MKDKTMAIGLYLAVGLIAAGFVLAAADTLFGNTQDNVIQKVKRVESY